MILHTYRWLLIDADNTLFDFNAAEEFALTRTLVRFGLPVTGEVKSLYKAINAQVWQEYEKGTITQDALRPERFARFLSILGAQGDPETLNAFYTATLAQCPNLIPGAEALCRNLSRRYVLCLCTNGSPAVQRPRLRASSLSQYFPDERVFISEEMGCQKPEKAYFEKVLAAIGAQRDKGRVLVIGDSLSSDIRGAFNARLDSVWLHWPSVKAGTVKPTYEVENLAQLSKLLWSDRPAPILP